VKVRAARNRHVRSSGVGGLRPHLREDELAQELLRLAQMIGRSSFAARRIDDRLPHKVEHAGLAGGRQLLLLVVAEANRFTHLAGREGR
jgi:hypothetical protein